MYFIDRPVRVRNSGKGYPAVPGTASLLFHLGGTLTIVSFYPFTGYYSHLTQIKEQLRVQNSLPVEPVKPFPVSVLHGVTGLCKLAIDPSPLQL